MSNRMGRAEADTKNWRLWIIVSLLFALTLGGSVAAKRWTDRIDGAGPSSVGALTREVKQAALSLSGRLDRGAVHVGGDGLVHLELIATGTTRPDVALVRRPTDVVVVLDRSGSMGGDPMEKAVAAIRELVGRLGRDDRFALVTYSNDSDLEIPLESASTEARARWASRLGSIGAGGGTNMAAGLDQAHSLVMSTREGGRVARVILLSDGHANQGDSSPNGLARRSGRAVSGEYVLTTVGVGEGFDERLMTRLADAGTGNFYYVPHVEVLAGIFSSEFESARETVASALEIRIDTPTGVEVLDAAGYPIERGPGHVVFRPGSLFSGQTRSLWVTLRVPTKSAGEIALGEVQMQYRTAHGALREVKLASFPAIAALVEESQFVAKLDPDAIGAHHVEETINRLRQSVSQLVASGDYVAARSALDSVDYDELKSVGIKEKETQSYIEVEKLKDDIARAAAAPASLQGEMRNRLGKSLYEAGTDGRRKGAKR